MVKEYIDKNTTIMRAIRLKKWVSKQNSNDEPTALIFKDCGEEFRINFIEYKFDYFDAEGDNEELTKQCNKALENIENWGNDLLPALHNLRITDVCYNIVDKSKNVYGWEGYTLKIYIPVFEVKALIEPFYLDDEIETAPDDKYVVLGRNFNNITNARLFKKAIEMWAKTK